MNSDNSQSDMHIRRLRLRIPGTDTEAGRAFARQFTNELAARCQGLSSAHIGRLNLQIRPSAEQPGSHTIAAQAAEAVAARLNSQSQNHA